LLTCFVVNNSRLNALRSLCDVSANTIGGFH
jgi:hypothetical protein